jgi:hypothetical protein
LSGATQMVNIGLDAICVRGLHMASRVSLA